MEVVAVVAVWVPKRQPRCALLIIFEVMVRREPGLECEGDLIVLIFI